MHFLNPIFFLKKRIPFRSGSTTLLPSISGDCFDRKLRFRSLVQHAVGVPDQAADQEPTQQLSQTAVSSTFPNYGIGINIGLTL